MGVLGPKYPVRLPAAREMRESARSASGAFGERGARRNVVIVPVVSVSKQMALVLRGASQASMVLGVKMHAPSSL